MSGLRGPDGEARPGPDDRALLRAHLEGDPDAFGELFTRHRDRLWAVALRTTGDPEEAADSLQDALVAAFRRAGSYRGDAAVTTWLHRIVVNACLDRLRRRSVRRTEPLPDDLGDRSQHDTATPAVPASAGVVDPADLAVDAERRAAVLAALDTLPPDQRAAVVLVDLEGYSVDEVATLLDCPQGTVKSRCSRARAKLLPLLVDHQPVRNATRTPSRTSAGTPGVVPDGDDRATGRRGPRNPRAGPRVEPAQAPTSEHTEEGP
ncbi:MAG TPA: RNA polymerase sigma factor SigM [Nocardioidaceae bacterium]|nr:RNA polymerase sigma factor SigM [Nocardioidaceae bacterium]